MTAELREINRLLNNDLTARGVCDGVVKRYIAITQGVDPDTIWPGDVPDTTPYRFKMTMDGPVKQLQLSLVDRNDPLFDILDSDTTREAMMHICNAFVPYANSIVENVDLTRVPRHELLRGSRFVMTPHTTFLLGNIRYGQYLHENVPARIGFTWGPDL